MPASMSLRALGMLTALAIALAALWPLAAAPPHDPYSMIIKLMAGSLAIIGSLYLAYAVGGTFLRGSGRGAFKALYWASIASVGAGMAEAASGFIVADVPLAAAMAAFSFAGAGLMLIFYSGGG
jgi:hypothetical protein